jgi:hypothetical protein
MNMKRDESCMVCLDTPAEGARSRFYCKACGKPTCETCFREYNKTAQSMGAGCVGCRSTGDVLHVISDTKDASRIVLRLNGNSLVINLSERAMRVAYRSVSRASRASATSATQEAELGPLRLNASERETDEYMTKLFERCNREYSLAMKGVFDGFLEHEITHNHRAKAMVADRLTRTVDDTGLARMAFGFIFSSL